MKNVFLIAALSLAASQSFGATVKSAKLDASGKNILIDVMYAGGCGKHNFFLKMSGCLETFPAQCRAELVDKTNDKCEALISKTVVISLEKAGLTNSYYQRASLTITGDKDSKTNKPSKATIRLP